MVPWKVSLSVLPFLSIPSTSWLSTKSLPIFAWIACTVDSLNHRRYSFSYIAKNLLMKSWEENLLSSFEITFLNFASNACSILIHLMAKALLHTFIDFTNRLIHTKKKRRAILLLASRFKGSRIARQVWNEQRWKPLRRCKYIVYPPYQRMFWHPKTMRAVYNTSLGAFPLLCSWLVDEFARFLNRQNQSVQKRLLPICMSAQPLPIKGFTRARHCKYSHFFLNSFILPVKSFFDACFLTIVCNL